MSELAAIYGHLEAVASDEPEFSSIDDFFSNLVAAGFEPDSALVEIAGVDNRLSMFSNRAKVLAYAQSKNISSVEQLIVSIVADCPGSLQELLDYSMRKHQEISSVAGGRSSIQFASVLSSLPNSHLRSKLDRLSLEASERRMAKTEDSDVSRPAGVNAGEELGHDAGGEYTHEQQISRFATGRPGNLNSEEN